MCYTVDALRAVLQVQSDVWQSRGLEGRDSSVHRHMTGSLK